MTEHVQPTMCEVVSKSSLPLILIEYPYPPKREERLRYYIYVSITDANQELLDANLHHSRDGIRSDQVA